MARFKGILKTVHESKAYGFIDIKSVTYADSSRVGAYADTMKDIFLHQDSCDSPLRVGMEVVFSVEPDEKRGEKTYRAYSAEETLQSSLQELGQGGIEIHVQGEGTSPILEHSTVFTKCCLSRELAEKVKALKLEAMDEQEERVVRLLLVEWPTSGEVGGHHSKNEKRYLIDLNEKMTCLSFDSPGRHVIVAMLVWASKESTLVDLLVTRSGSDYKTDIISREGDKFLRTDDDRQWRNVGTAGTGCTQVDVPEEIFAKEPFDWELVNWWFSNKPPRDQCAFNRRRIVAYPAYVVIFPLLIGVLGVFFALKWSVSLLYTLLLLSFGVRVDAKNALRHPKDFGPSDVKPLSKPWFISEGKNHLIFFPLMFSPGALGFTALSTFLIHATSTHEWVWSWHTFTTAYLSAVVTFFVINLLLYLAFFLFDKSVDKKAEAERRKQEILTTLNREIEELTCTPENLRVPDVWALPLGPKTFRFYFTAAKQKVCRGFATR